MCGICGIIYKDPERRVDPALLHNMVRVQNHRGPDDQGVWHQGNVGLGHVRLSIIDLSPLGHQPMTNEDGSVWISFNGEIYNFLELREELKHKGHQFRSRTDTEVIVHLWEEEGVRCVERLRGMFAFAIWDDRQKVLFLARDRMGKKPLFYAMLPDRFLFGSEIKAILEDPDFRSEPDIQAIHYYLTYQSVPSPFSAFKGINKLPPAHCMLVKEGAGTPRRYWKLSYRNKLTVAGPRAEADLEEEIQERLREAVRIRLVSDVPLGAFLSGGLDSSMIVALMAGMGNSTGEDLFHQLRPGRIQRGPFRPDGGGPLSHGPPRIQGDAGRPGHFPGTGLALQRALRGPLRHPHLLCLEARPAACHRGPKRRRGRREFRRLPPLRL